jgi:integrase
VVQGFVIEHQRISTRCVSRAVQRAVGGAGLDGHYSAHSLRAGLATSAYAHGATEIEIQKQGRWLDTRSVRRYIQIERVPGRKNVAEGLL